ncbi:hypothetical protein GCM10017562_36000 [Streptomyces roseofulvus]|uniref:Uncharacterized protein n=2 Tax=Streptomyces TaxID=1883 RepID=A0ABU4K5K1_9ACTN|nr:hypothetical protein [Streptomyces roseolus]MDX2293031.1 hypothetical protein [Streptomyces roseolus]
MTRMVRALGAIAFAAAAAVGVVALNGEPTWDAPPAHVVAAPGEPTWDLVPVGEREPTWDFALGEPTWDVAPAGESEPTWDSAPLDSGA